MSTATIANKRIEALDYLRGFFIIVIITDHLWRWPNIFQYVSGRGELWVSAAEGFVIISGLLVGYVRGRKGLKKSFAEISKKLLLRGLMLYIWTIITAVILVAATWYLSFKANIPYVPYGESDWGGLLGGVMTLNYAHVLTHFLYLYAIFLVLSPCFVWLFRKNLWWLGAIISLAGWWYGFTVGNEWLQWQILFFLPATAGFYLDQIIAFFGRIPKPYVYTAVFASLCSILVSAMIILPHQPGTYVPEIFHREPLTLARIGLSFVWFTTLLWVFNRALPWLEKYVGWLLLPIGTRSLTAYIVSGFVIITQALIIPDMTGFLPNTLIACGVILATWAIVRIPGINRVIPR